MAKTNLASAVLVIGNGIDKNQNLASSFSDFFNTFRTQDGEKFEGKKIRSNIWYVFFLFRFFVKSDSVYIPKVDENDPRWFDIEGFIADILNSHRPEERNHLLQDVQLLLAQGGQPDAINPFYSNSTESIIYDQYPELASSINEIMASNKRKYHPRIGVFEFLFLELKRFEDDFCDYLEKAVLAKSDFDQEYSRRINWFSHDLGGQKIFVLNFNYTQVKTPTSEIDTEIHPHGTLENKDIIIGIDNNDVRPTNGQKENTVLAMRRFTKAWRKAQIQQNSQPIPDKAQVRALAFYGLSLGRPDYSYYQALFDYYEVYDSDIKLVFYYSIYDSTKRTEIQTSYLDAVLSLLYDYASHNLKDRESTSFVSKLQLEGRLEIKEAAFELAEHREAKR